MAGNPHPNTANLRPPWKKGQSGNPKGRAKNTAKAAYEVVLGKTSAKRLYNLTNADIDEWDNLILSVSITDLQLLVKADNVPAYPRALMMAILTEMKNGTSRTIEKLRDRQHAKAIKHEITGANGEALIPEKNLTPTEARDFLKNLIENV